MRDQVFSVNSFESRNPYNLASEPNSWQGLKRGRKGAFSANRIYFADLQRGGTWPYEPEIHVSKNFWNFFWGYGGQIKQFGRINKFFNFLPNRLIEKKLTQFCSSLVQISPPFMPSYCYGRNSKGQVGYLKQIPKILHCPPPPPTYNLSICRQLSPPRLRPCQLSVLLAWYYSNCNELLQCFRTSWVNIVPNAVSETSQHYISYTATLFGFHGNNEWGHFGRSRSTSNQQSPIASTATWNASSGIRHQYVRFLRQSILQSVTRSVCYIFPSITYSDVTFFVQ